MLWKRATYDISIFKNPNGSLKKLDSIPKAWRCCIDDTEPRLFGKNAEVREVITKLADRDKAIDKLDKYVNLTGNKEDDSNKLSDETMKNLMDKLKGE
jgi:hypothetical protein